MMENVKMAVKKPLFNRLIIPIAIGSVSACTVWILISSFLGRLSDINPQFYALHFSNFRTTMVIIGGSGGYIIATFYEAFPHRKTQIQDKIIIGGISNLVAFIFCFSVAFFIASTPPLSSVSICFALRPWWKIDNWIIASFFSFIFALVSVYGDSDINLLKKKKY